MNDYFINKGTCAIIPLEKNLSKVIELDREFIINKSVKDIINESCKYFGSSYQGRFEGSKKILRMNYKLPIVVEEYNNIIFFPTSSPRFNECTWISLKNITDYFKSNKNTNIFFGDVCLNLDVSYYSFENQVFRATMLESLIRRRKEDI